MWENHLLGVIWNPGLAVTTVLFKSSFSGLRNDLVEWHGIWAELARRADGLVVCRLLTPAPVALERSPHSSVWKMDIFSVLCKYSFNKSPLVKNSSIWKGTRNPKSWEPLLAFSFPPHTDGTPELACLSVSTLLGDCVLPGGLPSAVSWVCSQVFNSPLGQVLGQPPVPLPGSWLGQADCPWKWKKLHMKGRRVLSASGEGN